MNREWAEQNKKTQRLLTKATFSEGIDELIVLRDMLMEEILSWKQLSPKDFSAMPFMNAEGYHSKSVAYSLWHIFRIEDIVVNSLIRRQQEVLVKGAYPERMHASVITTGNELKGEEIYQFSEKLDICALYEYITEVKASTEEWLKSLEFSDLKTCFNDEDKQYLRTLGVVSSDESSDWLVDYWCSKNVGGLMKMPLSRHWIMHIEASLRILKKLGAK